MTLQAGDEPLDPTVETTDTIVGISTLPGTATQRFKRWSFAVFKAAMQSGTAASSHGHTISGVTGLQAALDSLQSQITALGGGSGTAPNITSNGGGASASISAAEGTTAVTTVVATGTGPIVYSKSGADAAAFNLNSSTGALTFASAPTYASGGDNIRDLIVTATGATAPADTQALQITITEASSWTWPNTLGISPPTMTSPLVISSQAQLDPYLTTYSELPPGAASPLFPAGQIYLINAAGQDVVLDARTFTVTKSVKILEAQNVRVLGKIAPALVAAGAPGQCSTQNEVGGLLTYRNIYPRPVGGNALQISCTHVCMLEGLHVNFGGQNGDCVVVNGVNAATAASTLASLDIYVVNCRFEGYVGHVANYSTGGPAGAPLGDSPHADAVQYQSESLSYRRFWCENVSMLSGQEGLVGTPNGAWAASAKFKSILAYPDFNHVDPDQSHWSYIAPFGCNAKLLTFDECYAYQSQVYNVTTSTLGVGENHCLYWNVTPDPDKIMYFTDGNGSTWGNAGYGSNTTPVPAGLELDMETWVPTPYNPASFTSVVLHAGIHTIPGTIAAANMSIPVGKDFAPAAHVGLNYVSPWPVPGASSGAPASTVAPAIAGATIPGARVTVSTGTWSNSPTSYAYAWQRSTNNSAWFAIADSFGSAATGNAHSVDFARAGEYVRCAVTATNASGSATAYTTSYQVVDTDPVYSGTPTALPALSTGQTLNLSGNRYTVTGTIAAPSNLTINGPGEIIFANASAILSFAGGTTGNNVCFTGALSTKQQFALLHNGVQSFFASPTLSDSGAGMTHSLAGSVLTVNLNGGTQRQVISSLISLDTSKKYAVKVLDGFTAGNAQLPVVFRVCDSGGGELSDYNPQAPATVLALQNAAGIKIKVGCLKYTSGPANMSATFDLSKIIVYEVINDLAAAVAAGGLQQNTTNIYATSNSTFTDCRFRMMPLAAAKVINSTDCHFVRPVVRNSLGCISSQASTRTIYTDANIDTRATDQNGALVPIGLATRNHSLTAVGVAGVAPEVDSEVVRGVMIGASWGFECPEGGNVSSGVKVSGAKIVAEHCGTSNCATNGIVEDCIIDVSPLCYLGIETPTGNGAIMRRNKLYQDCSAMLSHGIAASGGMQGMVIEDNVIRCAVATQCTVISNEATDRNITIQRNDMRYWVNALAYNPAGIQLLNNTGTRIGSSSMRGATTVPAIYQWSAQPLEANSGNTLP